MRFWLNKGVDGFRIDAVPYLFEDIKFRDEPLTGTTDDPASYYYTEHIYTVDQIETYEMVSQWRSLVDKYSKKSGNQRIMFVEAYTNLKNTMKLYNYGAYFPFNFGLITSVNSKSTALDFKNVIESWQKALPRGAISNWVVSEIK